MRSVRVCSEKGGGGGGVKRRHTTTGSRSRYTSGQQQYGRGVALYWFNVLGAPGRRGIFFVRRRE
jgi:hypothetical protein